MILLTNGYQTREGNADNPGLIADSLRKEGVLIFVIGIGGDIVESELKHIAGSKENFYQVKSFDNLISPEFVKKLSHDSCTKGMANPIKVEVFLEFSNLFHFKKLFRIF